MKVINGRIHCGNMSFTEDDFLEMLSLCGSLYEVVRAYDKGDAEALAECIDELREPCDAHAKIHDFDKAAEARIRRESASLRFAHCLLITYTLWRL